MAKLTINDVSSGYVSTTALNTAFTAIETALENTLSRDGTSPNQMSANLDMNGYAILNARATSGNENFIWMGTWTTGTVYAVNNLIYAPEGSNEGNTLICVTAHTAGATLDGDAAKWAVFAQRGAPGASGGDVVGPASSTPDSLARFNGTTGKLLKDGAVIGVDVQAYSANLAALSALSTGTSSGNIPLVGTESATDTVAGLVRKSTTAENAAGTGTGVVAAADLPTAVAALTGGGGDGQFQSMKIITASGTYTKPVGLKRVKVTCVGGGGGGSNSVTANFIAFGGAGGGTAIKVIEASAIGATETVTIGGGGAGATGTASAAGGTGGTTSFGAHCSATGGAGGIASAGTSWPIGYGMSTGGNGVGGDINLPGGFATAPELGATETDSRSGGGGGSTHGIGATITPKPSNGYPGSGYGGGGGGGMTSSATDMNGGAGTAGICIVEEFF